MTLPTPVEAPASFRDQRIAVVGLGIEGHDAVQFLEREGADCIRVDRNPERAERSPDDLAILDEVDGLIASQGVHYQVPLLGEAERRNIPVYGPTQIFLERSPAPVIGITGSAGKTTTTTLVHLLLQAAGIRCHLGGNIGQGLLQRLPVIASTDTVVAEISHTQLLRTTPQPADCRNHEHHSKSPRPVHVGAVPGAQVPNRRPPIVPRHRDFAIQRSARWPRRHLEPRPHNAGSESDRRRCPGSAPFAATANISSTAIAG